MSNIIKILFKHKVKSLIGGYFILLGLLIILTFPLLIPGPNKPATSKRVIIHLELSRAEKRLETAQKNIEKLDMQLANMSSYLLFAKLYLQQTGTIAAANDEWSCVTLPGGEKKCYERKPITNNQNELEKSRVRVLETRILGATAQKYRLTKNVVSIEKWIKNNRPSSNFTYNQVKEMTKGDSKTVTLLLVPNKGQLPTLSPVLSGTKKSGIIDVTPYMSARLEGSAGLSVKSNSPEKQLTSLVAASSWQWNVLPIRDGQETLTLKIFSHIGTASGKPILRYEDLITVNITRWQYIKEVASEINPIWAFVVVAAPAFWGAYDWLRKRSWQQPKKPKPQPRRQDVPPRANRPVRNQKRWSVYFTHQAGFAAL